MRSWLGRDYQFYVWNEDTADEGPYYLDGFGALLCYFGEVHVSQGGVGTYTVTRGEAVQWSGQVKIDGSGTFAAATVMSRGPRQPWLHRAAVDRHNKPWGHELDVRVDSGRFMLKYLQVEPNHRTSLQVHDHKDETMFFIDDALGFVNIPPDTEHRVGSHKLHRYFEASTYHPDDVIRLEDDYNR